MSDSRHFVGRCNGCGHEVEYTLPVAQADHNRIRVSCARCGRTAYCDSANDRGAAQRDAQRWHNERLCIPAEEVDCWFPGYHHDNRDQQEMIQ
jgi:hypothetical protein